MTTVNGAIIATPNAPDQRPGPSRDLTYSVPIETDTTRERLTPEETMETNEEEDDIIPATQGPPSEKLPTLLEHKAHLRQVLLRAEHHSVFL